MQYTYTVLKSIKITSDRNPLKRISLNDDLLMVEPR